MLGQDIPETPFFQYWYTLKQLNSYVRQAGFEVSLKLNSDYIYPLWEFRNFFTKVPPLARLLAWLERFDIPLLGGQNFVLAVKPGSKLQCFLLKDKTAEPESLVKYFVPLSQAAMQLPYSKFYLRRRGRSFPSTPYQFLTPRISPHQETCRFGGGEFITSEFYEDYGFDLAISPEKLKDPAVNVKLAFKHVQMRWRNCLDPYNQR
jgi:hypothetical protein